MFLSKRWKSILTFVAGLTMAAAIAMPAAATVDGPKVTWRIALFGKPRASTQHLERIKEYVESETGGNFTIDLGYGTFGEPKEFLDLVKIGSVQGALIVPSYTPGRLPLYSVMDLPFLPLGSPEVQRKVYEALHADPRIKAEFDAWGAFPLMGNYLPPYELMGKGEPPKSLEDLKGERARATGAMGKALENLGIVPTNLPAPEIYNAFDRGLVDLVALPHYAHVSYKTYEVGNWVTTNLSLGTIGFPVIINKAAWAALPKQYQELMNKAVEEGYAALDKAVTESDEKSFAAYKEKGIKLVEVSDSDLEQFREKGGKPVWEEWIKEREAEGLPGNEILDLLLTTAKNATK